MAGSKDMTHIPSTQRLLFGTEVRCSDGRIGRLQGLILDEKPLTVSRLLVRLDGLFGLELQVSIEKMIRFSEKRVELICDRANLPDLEMVEESEREDEAATALEFLGDDHLSMYVVSASRHNTPSHMWVNGSDGTIVKQSTPVWAQDGPAGKLAGVSVDVDGQLISDFLTVTGYWPKRRVVAVPVADIVGVEKNVVSLRVDNKAIALMPAHGVRKDRSVQQTPNI